MDNIVDLSKEINYQGVIQSWSVQDIALDNSTNQRLKSFEEYEEMFKIIKDWKRKYLNRREKHANLITKLTEALMITNSFEQLQTIPNKKLMAVYQDLTNQHQETSVDSDKFASLVKETVSKIQNLSAEFDESAISEKKSVCNQEIDKFVQIFSKEYETLQENLKFGSNAKSTHSDTFETVDKVAKKSEKLLPKIMLQNEGKASLSRKNIEYLTQKFNELKIQCGVLGSSLVN